MSRPSKKLPGVADCGIPLPVRHHQSFSYSRARLLLGISNVGFWVCVASAFLIFRLFDYFPTGKALDRQALISLTLFLGGYVFLQIPFDLVGGFFLPKHYGRYLGEFSDYVSTWARGAVVQGGVLFAVAISALLLTDWLALWAIGWATILLNWQLRLACLIADLRTRGKDRVKSQDEAFTGGTVGLPGLQKNLLSNERDPLFSSIMRKRRLLLQQMYLPASGVIVAIGFHLVGIFSVSLLVDHPGTVRGLVESACWYTLWSFCGLLLLPSVSRPAVYAADHALFARGVSEEDFRHYLALQPLENATEHRPGWVETLFYPVPSVRNRLARWGQEPRWRGAWHAARYAVYLSWGGLSLLGRSVHCNIGQPAVWVILPCD